MINKNDLPSMLLKVGAISLPVILSFFVLQPSIPLGEPGVWVWQRILPLQLDLPGIAAAGLCFAVSAVAAWKLDFGGGDKKRALLLAAVILLGGIGADRMILTSGRAGLAENALAILNPFTTGYLQPERSCRSVTRDFVKDVLTVPEKEVPHHRHVHPPANIYLTEIVKRLPGDWGRALLPEVYQTLQELRQADALIPPLDTPAMMEAALKLVLIFWLALELGKALLMYMLWNLPGIRGRGLALLTTAFGSNCALLFLGHYDTFYFLIASAVLLAVFYAFRKPAFAVAAGILTGIGGLFTLGFGAVGGVAAGVLLTGTEGKSRWRSFGFFAGAGLFMAFMLYAQGIYVWDIALKCLENQRLFQAMSGRGYVIWSGLNVLDALLFCGVLPCLAILIPPASRGRVFKMWLCALLFWLFILFSGGARGEFGRLAAVYLPVLLLILGVRVGRNADNKREWLWIAAAIALMLWQTALLRNALKLVLID